MLRPLTDYEGMVFAFLARSEYTRGHLVALATATTEAEYEDVIARAVERYEDWASD
jgi:hypothetical protein